MLLVNLIYASQTRPDFSQNDIQDMLRDAIRHNERNGLTGMLLFHSGQIVQCLEGSRQAVNEAYQRIVTDARHHSPMILGYQEISQRQFPDWAMGFIGETSCPAELLLKYSVTGQCQPAQMTGESARRLLAELADRMPRQRLLTDMLQRSHPAMATCQPAAVCCN